MNIHNEPMVAVMIGLLFLLWIVLAIALWRTVSLALVAGRLPWSGTREGCDCFRGCRVVLWRRSSPSKVARTFVVRTIRGVFGWVFP